MLSARAGSLAPTARTSWYSKYVPDSSCVLWLPGQDDAYSSTIRDRSGYGNDGAITGATWVRTSKGLWVLSFDGIDDVVAINPLSSSVTTSTLWMHLWYKQTAQLPAAQYCWIATLRSADGVVRFHFQADPSSWAPRAYFRSSDASSIIVSAGYTDGSIWRCIDMVWEAQTLSLYIEGTYKGQDGPSTDNSCTMTQFHLSSPVPAYLTGNIAGVFVSTKTPTPEEIAGIYQHERHLFGV